MTDEIDTTPEVVERLAEEFHDCDELPDVLRRLVAERDEARARVAELEAESEAHLTMWENALNVVVKRTGERDEARARAAAAYQAAALFADCANRALEAEGIGADLRAGIATDAERDALADALAKARAGERERCASVAMSYANKWRNAPRPSDQLSATREASALTIAAAIRDMEDGE